MSLEGSSLVSARKIHKQVVKIFGRTKVSNVCNTALRRPNEELKGPWVLSMRPTALLVLQIISQFSQNMLLLFQKHGSLVSESTGNLTIIELLGCFI